MFGCWSGDSVNLGLLSISCPSKVFNINKFSRGGFHASNKSIVFEFELNFIQHNQHSIVQIQCT